MSPPTWGYPHHFGIFMQDKLQRVPLDKDRSSNKLGECFYLRGIPGGNRVLPSAKEVQWKCSGNSVAQLLRREEAFVLRSTHVERGPTRFVAPKPVRYAIAANIRYWPILLI